MVVENVHVNNADKDGNKNSTFYEGTHARTLVHLNSQSNLVIYGTRILEMDFNRIRFRMMDGMKEKIIYNKISFSQNIFYPYTFN